ncbi:MAG: hypothetical protein LBV72_02435 [Tannerella sp.]|jgi:hypothetical protein|nr:hypothetical protein [Tannerella sp.]
MNKYRKMYNENLLGTSDVSILKFYYASFKLQYSKGRITDLSAFLDDCARISEETNLMLKISSVIPFFNLLFGTGREQKHIAEIIRTKREEVEKLFVQDDISDEDIKSLLYGISPLTQVKSLTKEEMLLLVKEKILKCYSLDGKRQLGDRIFGYLLKSEILPPCSRKDHLNVWYDFLEQKVKPSNDRLFANPDKNGSQNNGCTRKLLKDLYSIRDFYDNIGLTKIVRIIDRDIKDIPK